MSVTKLLFTIDAVGPRVPFVEEAQIESYVNISEFRKEFCKLGKSFDDLSKSFELDLGSGKMAIFSSN